MLQKRVAIAVLVLMLAGLQWRLWVSQDGMSSTSRLQDAAESARQENTQRSARNAELDAEVHDLNSGSAAIEARARTTLGMIKPNETFFLVVQ